MIKQLEGYSDLESKQTKMYTKKNKSVLNS